MADALATPAIDIQESRFELVSDRAEDGDFVYFDPPYAPLSQTAQFRSYTAHRFENADQQRLSEIAVLLAARGVHVMLSNSTASSVTYLYERDGASRHANLSTYRLPARRSINSRATSRGAIEELLVTNLARRDPPEAPL